MCPLESSERELTAETRRIGDGVMPCLPVVSNRSPFENDVLPRKAQLSWSRVRVLQLLYSRGVGLGSTRSRNPKAPRTWKERGRLLSNCDAPEGWSKE